MVCHETYKDDKNNWISPDEIVSINGKILKDSKESTVGPSNQCQNQKTYY